MYSIKQAVKITSVYNILSDQKYLDQNFNFSKFRHLNEDVRMAEYLV